MIALAVWKWYFICSDQGIDWLGWIQFVYRVLKCSWAGVVSVSVYMLTECDHGDG